MTCPDSPSLSPLKLGRGAVLNVHRNQSKDEDCDNGWETASD